MNDSSHPGGIMGMADFGLLSLHIPSQLYSDHSSIGNLKSFKIVNHVYQRIDCLRGDSMAASCIFGRY